MASASEMEHSKLVGVSRMKKQESNEFIRWSVKDWKSYLAVGYLIFQW